MKNPTRQPISSVIVVGGGLAGIATAVRLSAAGIQVTVVETRQRLGGRATSFVDPSTGRLVDNCQHVLLGCCTHLIELYRRLGVLDQIQWHRRLYFWDGRGAVDELEADDLPAPFHLTRSLMRLRSLTATEKCAIARAMWAMVRMDRSRRRQLEQITFSQWLDQHRQPPAAVEQFWSPIVTGAVNETPQRVNAGYAIQVFQEGFIGAHDAYMMGLPMVPLVQLYDRAQRVITASGGQMLLSTSAERFDYRKGAIEALVLSDQRRLVADAFVGTVPFDRLLKLCPTEMKRDDDRLQRLGEVQVSPIIGAHFWFSGEGARNGRPLMTLPHLVLTRSPLHWIFNKGRDPDTLINGRATHHLHGVISAAHDLVAQPAQRIIQICEREIRDALTATGGWADAPLVHARVIKEKRATFSATPGVTAMRPSARGTIPNLFLAGDWCDTGWPATMEGAVRSGDAAAAAVLDDAAAAERPFVANDLPADRLYRWLHGAARHTMTRR